MIGFSPYIIDFERSMEAHFDPQHFYETLISELYQHNSNKNYPNEQNSTPENMFPTNHYYKYRYYAISGNRNKRVFYCSGRFHTSIYLSLHPFRMRDSWIQNFIMGGKIPLRPIYASNEDAAYIAANRIAHVDTDGTPMWDIMDNHYALHWLEGDTGSHYVGHGFCEEVHHLYPAQLETNTDKYAGLKSFFGKLIGYVVQFGIGLVTGMASEGATWGATAARVAKKQAAEIFTVEASKLLQQIDIPDVTKMILRTGIIEGSAAILMKYGDLHDSNTAKDLTKGEIKKALSETIKNIPLDKQSTDQFSLGTEMGDMANNIVDNLSDPSNEHVKVILSVIASKKAEGGNFPVADILGDKYKGPMVQEFIGIGSGSKSSLLTLGMIGLGVYALVKYLKK